jgi:hypothetical protein
MEEEERRRQVMGMSATGKCLILVNLSGMLKSEGGSGEGGKVLSCLKAKGIKLEGWYAETMVRYITVGRTIKAVPGLAELMEQWEFQLGRQAALDSITALRALAGLKVHHDDILYIAAGPACTQTD